MTSNQTSSNKNGAVGQKPNFTADEPVTSKSLYKDTNPVAVLSSSKNVRHRPEDNVSNPQDRNQSSVSTQSTIVGNTLSETLMPPSGGKESLGNRSDNTQTMDNQPPLDGGYTYQSSEHYVQSTSSAIKTEKVEPVTQREEEAASCKDQATGTYGDDYQQDTVAYRGLRLPLDIFEPVDWHGEDIPESPELLHLSHMDNNDLTHYLKAITSACDCDYFTKSELCPLHGRGQHSLKRWTNDLLDTYYLYKTDKMCSPRHKLVVSTSTPSDSTEKVNLEKHFAASKDISAIQPHNVEPTYTGKLKQAMRQRLKDYYDRGQDSGLVDKKTDHAPPLTPHLEKLGGSVTKAKTLALKGAQLSFRDKSLDKSSGSFRERLNKKRISTPTRRKN